MSRRPVVADTSGLCALLDRSSRAHGAVRSVLRGLDRPLVVPEPTLVELDHLSRRFGRTAFFLFLEDLRSGAFDLEPIGAEDLHPLLLLGDRFRDLDPGYADLAVVRVAQRLGAKEILTLDLRDFRVLRADDRPFVLLPADA